jgi:hypothetical protein
MTGQPDGRAGLTDSQKLSGDIGQYLFDEFCSEMGFRFGGEKYRLAYDEEATDLGYPDDPYSLIVRRERDGEFFEVELEATVRSLGPVDKAAAATDRAEEARS